MPRPEVERVLAADAEAYASMLAFQLGPDTFLQHIEAKAEEVRRRIKEEFYAVADIPPELEGEDHESGDGSGGSRAGGSPSAPRSLT